jgi:hypothetical protein
MKLFKKTWLHCSRALANFVARYTEDFDPDRSIAVQRLATAVTLLQDLNSELTRPSSIGSKLESFNDTADRQAFYVSIYPLLGNCLYAVRQSLYHFNLALNQEQNSAGQSNTRYTPKVFYKTTSEQAKCMSRYTFVGSVLQILQTQLLSPPNECLIGCMETLAHLPAVHQCLSLTVQQNQ